MKWYPNKQNGFLRWLLRSLKYMRDNIKCVFVAFWIAVVVALLGGFIKYLETSWDEDIVDKFTPSEDIYKGFTTLVTMMIVFHTAQSYSRFMSGITLVYQMSADFVDTASLLTAFCKASCCADAEKNQFLNTMVRLFSMLFVSCLADLERRRETSNASNSAKKKGKAHMFDVLDPGGLDQKTLKIVCQSQEKTFAINQRIIDLMMTSIEKKILSSPPPIVSRAFQELGMGMARFHEALKFKDAPFPVPYIVVADMLMLIHSMMTPFVMTRWADTIMGAIFFCFVPSFSLWALHGIAEELDNPFSDSQTNLDSKHMTDNFNQHLLSLLDHAHLKTSPTLADTAEVLPSSINVDVSAPLRSSSTFSSLKVLIESVSQECHRINESKAFSIDANDTSMPSLNEMIGIPDKVSKMCSADPASECLPEMKDLEMNSHCPCHRKDLTDSEINSRRPCDRKELEAFATVDNFSALLDALRQTSQALETLLQQALPTTPKMGLALATTPSTIKRSAMTPALTSRMATTLRFSLPRKIRTPRMMSPVASPRDSDLCFSKLGK